jgi:hypothetical protein
MKFWHIMVAMVVVGAYLISALLFPIYTSRFRLTVEVETSEGLKSGSSVIETTIQDVKVGFPGMVHLDYGVHGEAVFVDLGQDHHVIALLAFGPTGQEQYRLNGLVRAALARGRQSDWWEEASLRGSGDLPPDYVPTLVTFTDLNDPKTAQVLYATEIYETREGTNAPRRNVRVAIDRFAETFGPGVRFKRAWIETVSKGIWPLSLVGITGEPVTRGIEQKLPWLRSHTGYLAGRQHDPTWSRPSRNLTGNEFIKGL